MQHASKKDFYNSLPRKRSATGVLIFKDGLLLALEPTYKTNWLVPGGIVEASESPLEAAIRECKEEIGLDVEIVSFLCADYKRGDNETGDAVHFLFLGKIADDAEIKINEKEIKQYLWTSPENAISKFDEHLGTRVRCALEAIETGSSYYCEEGNIIF